MTRPNPPWQSGFLALLATALMAAHVLAQSPSENLLPDPQHMARVEASVDRALEYLVKQQNADGSWTSFSDSKNNGINAMCLLAFLGRGHVPGRGPYQFVVDRAVRYLLATQDDKGMFQGRMYEHALSTLAMIEAYGFIPSPQVRQSAQKAVDLIVKSQSPLGGWRYNPVPADADLSVTVMQVVALRAAQNARLEVPKDTLERALQYTRACAVASGGFSYQPGGGASAAQSAAGALSMQLLGAFDDPTVSRALDLLEQQEYQENIRYFWYMNYYAMQAHFQAGGAYWDRWQRKVGDFLLRTQNEDGSWPGYGEQTYNGTKGFCYSTALASMCLEVYLHYLPAYQR